MKRQIWLVLAALAILSLLIVAAGPPPGAKEKPITNFYARETCNVTVEGEKMDRDGYTFYKGRKYSCQLTSDDALIAGTVEIQVRDGRAGPSCHCVSGHFHLYTKDQEWFGYRWGKLEKDGSITWVGGWAGTPEAGAYWRYIAHFHFDGHTVNGFYEARGVD
jgi:hypothetical protein